MTDKEAALQPVTLDELTPHAADSLWTTGRNHADWPLFDHKAAAWKDWVLRMQAAEAIGWGCVRAAWANHRLLGFVTLQVVNPAHLPHLSAVECGTWLSPDARGQGWNHSVKLASLDLASTGPLSSEAGSDLWCMFVMDSANDRAIASLSRLDLPWTVEATLADPPRAKQHADSASGEAKAQRATTPPLRTFLRRRAWESGRALTLFAVHATDYARWREQHPTE